MIVSVTERGVWRRCQKQWYYSSNNALGLQRAGAGAPALELGSLVHAALAAWTIANDYTNGDTLQNHFIGLANDRVEQIKTTYREKVGASISDAELNPITDAIGLGYAMMGNYQERWGSPLPPDMRFASMEQEVVVPVPGTEHQCTCVGVERATCRECNSTGIALHYLSATLDGLLQNNRDKLFILERKTYSSRPTLDTLRMMDQFTGYVWVVRELKIGPVAGVAYDGMWKRATPPKNTKLEDLFIRTTIRKTDEELDIWGEALANELNDIASKSANMLYPNRRWEGCYDCGFQDVCTAQMRGEDYERLIKLLYVPREVNRVQGVRDEGRSTEANTL